MATIEKTEDTDRPVGSKKYPQRWPKGVSGNPHGRPPGGYAIVAKMRQSLLDALTEQRKPTEHPPYLEALDQLLGAMRAGQQWAVSKIMDLYADPGSLEAAEASYRRSMSADEDFIRYRCFRRAFDRQRSVLLTEALVRLEICGRRAGKTQGWALLVAQEIALGHEVLYIGRTLTVATEQMLVPLAEVMDELGVKWSETHRNEGQYVADTSGRLKISGNTTVDDRDRLRGGKYHLIIIDECQSQKQLMQLVTEVCEPMLADYRGVLCLSGTPPRVRGTWWEAVYTGRIGDGQAARQIYPRAFRTSWTLLENPYIADAEATLERIREEHGWTDTNPTYRREYLGELVYDDDALLLRWAEVNRFDPEAFAAWVKEQPVTDIRLSAGLDYGYEDADAYIVIAYSWSSPVRWVLAEYKRQREGNADLAQAIREINAKVLAMPEIAGIETKRIDIFADPAGAGKKITADFYVQYHLNIYDVTKADTEGRIELLQDEWKAGRIKVPYGGEIYDESLKTVFARNDRDELTRELDDAYHPDAIPALRYALAAPWARRQK